MVVNFKVFKKSSPNGKIMLYLGKRDFVDHISGVEPIGILSFDLDNIVIIIFLTTDGIIVLDQEYINEHRKIFGQVVCSFRYGRESDEMMGLNFQKELYLASEQLHPQPEKSDREVSKLQERLLKKLGPNAIPFTFTLPASAPASVILQKNKDDTGAPCGVEYYVKVMRSLLSTNSTKLLVFCIDLCW